MEHYYTGKRRPNSLRLQGFDYGTNGAYFVTCCSYRRMEIFSSLRNGEIELTSLGKLIEDEWKNTSNLRDYVTLDEFIVMPNHVHGILFIHKEMEEPDHLRQTGTYLFFPEGYQNEFGPQRKNLSSVVGAIKKMVSKRAHEAGFNGRIWQRSFHERIIRNEKELDKFRRYILDNPFQWELDDENYRIRDAG